MHAVAISETKQASCHNNVLRFWRRAFLAIPWVDAILDRIDWHDGPEGYENTNNTNKSYKRMLCFVIDGTPYDGGWIGRGQHRNVYALKDLNIVAKIQEASKNANRSELAALQSIRYLYPQHIPDFNPRLFPCAV